MDTKESLLGIVKTLLRWRKPIVFVTISAGILTAVLSLLFLSNYYKSTTTFFAASTDLAQPDEMFGSQRKDYYGTDYEVDRVLTIAKSEHLMTELVHRFDLYDHYKVDTTHPKAKFMVLRKLGKLYEVKKNKFNAIELSVEDKDRDITAPVANTARHLIDSLLTSVIKVAQGQTVATFDHILREEGKVINSLSDSLEQYREEFGIYNTESQSETLSKLVIETEAKLARAKGKVKSFANMTGRFRDSLRHAQVQVSGLEEELKSLNKRLTNFNSGYATVTVLEEELDKTKESFAKTGRRRQQYLSTYYSYAPAIHLMEEAQPPLDKSRPRRSILTLGAMFFAFVLTCLAALIADVYQGVTWRDLLGISSKPKDEKLPAK